MKRCSRFVCIPAGKINFLIPFSEVITSLKCNGDYFNQKKFPFRGKKIPFLNFYNENTHVEYFGEIPSIETALILKNKKLFEGEEQFAIITSKKCIVMELELRKFSLFGQRVEPFFNQLGFMACYFSDDSIYYLVDIEVFLKNFLI